LNSARHAVLLVPFFPGTLLVLVVVLVVVPVLDSARHTVRAFAGAAGDGLAGSGNLVGW
jgi:hypothetical protein